MYEEAGTKVNKGERRKHTKTLAETERVEDPAVGSFPRGG